jgi:hypothetical protein
MQQVLAKKQIKKKKSPMDDGRDAEKVRFYFSFLLDSTCASLRGCDAGSRGLGISVAWATSAYAWKGEGDGERDGERDGEKSTHVFSMSSAGHDWCRVSCGGDSLQLEWCFFTDVVLCICHLMPRVVGRKQPVRL